MKKYFAFLLLITSGILCFSFQQKQKFDLKASMERGKEIYNVQCIACHQEKGEGLEDIYPPLAKSDYLMADKKRVIHQIIRGLSGEIKVNGKIYNGEMPSFELSDTEVSDVTNYIRNSWGNKGGAITPEEVASARK